LNIYRQIGGKPRINRFERIINPAASLWKKWAHLKRQQIASFPKYIIMKIMWVAQGSGHSKIRLSAFT
ncbi:hypothetical protein P7M41_26030, partial [Vibrio parahaemolyticus]|nr:hypothetical protein [Vibrio parahaemolyticus]